jgi:hypothetical protein
MKMLDRIKVVWRDVQLRMKSWWTKDEAITYLRHTQELSHLHNQVESDFVKK